MQKGYSTDMVASWYFLEHAPVDIQRADPRFKVRKHHIHRCHFSSQYRELTGHFSETCIQLSCYFRMWGIFKILPIGRTVLVPINYETGGECPTIKLTPHRLPPLCI